MGLDMYLYRNTYVGAYFEHRNVTGTVELFTNGKKLDIDVSKISDIKERVAYWRKANAIHNWFVENVQDGKDECQESYVSKEDMQKLLDAVNQVLNSITLEKGVLSNGSTYYNGVETPNFITGEVVVDSAIAEEVLPTQSGFFFGNTDYNEWYVEDLKYTKEVLESILSKEDDDAEYYYNASW